jgi:enamine deaminase RidA (YjgF/YER057c/UK114 family)
VGDIVSVSGTTSLDSAGRAVPAGDVAEQTRRAFEIALQSLQDLGGAPGDVTRTRVYLLHGTDWNAAIRVHGDIFRDIDPANTTLFVSGFIPQDCLVEVEVDAVILGGEA